jgi:hypothetical protein
VAGDQGSIRGGSVAEDEDLGHPGSRGMLVELSEQSGIDLVPRGIVLERNHLRIRPQRGEGRGSQTGKKGIVRDVLDEGDAQPRETVPGHGIGRRPELDQVET